MGREYSSLRQACMMSIKAIHQTIPYSMLQLVIFLTYFWLILMPFAMYHKMTDGAEQVSFDIYAPASTFLVSLCFQALLRTIMVFSHPTGEDLDDINPEALLLETDETLLGFLKADAIETKLVEQLKITMKDELTKVVDFHKEGHEKEGT